MQNEFNNTANEERIPVPVLRIHQPIGEFFIGVIGSKDLIKISYADIRSMENQLDTYLGIQRRLSSQRVKDLQRYVTSMDASFPTSIIIAVEKECATFDESTNTLVLHSSDSTPFHKIAKILDGQHRIEGLKEYGDDDFQLNVTIFVNADIADQANIFATVNLAQTKVNKSLVYDLYDYAHSPSPQKTAHDVVVALDKHDKSALHKMIKRLGFATEGRTGETLTQATLVESLLNLFLSPEPQKDRDLLLKGKRLPKVSSQELQSYPFRNLFIEEREVEITKILLNYFAAVRSRWPEAWESREKGNILPRTNGVRALLRFLKPAYLSIVGNDIGAPVSTEKFHDLLRHVQLDDEDFSVENFPPGTTGESKLVRKLLDDTQLNKFQLSQPELLQ